MSDQGKKADKTEREEVVLTTSCGCTSSGVPVGSFTCAHGNTVTR